MGHSITAGLPLDLEVAPDSALGSSIYLLQEFPPGLDNTSPQE